MFDEKYKTDLFYHECQKWLNNVLETPGKMYHYTSVDVLRNIVQGKSMYATHINFMNDWEEYKLGYHILTNEIKASIETYRSDFETIIGKDNLNVILSYFSDECLNITNYSQIKQMEKFREFREFAIPEVYTISFCKEKDLLSQWVIYAKESGVAIEFDFTDFVFCDASLEDNQEAAYEKKDWQTIKYFRYNRPHTINYSDHEMLDKLQEQIREVVRMIKNPRFASSEEIVRPVTLLRRVAALYSIVPYCKLDKFKAENEVRLAFMRLEDLVEKDDKYEIFKTKVFYRTANQVLKPYLKIGWEAKKQGIYPIKRIIVGPGENQEAVFRGIIHFIENQSADIIPDYEGKAPFSEPMVDNSYMTCKGIIIQKSNIPYIFK